MMLMMVLFLVVPIALVAWGLGNLPAREGPAMDRETPLEILRRRYARGEVSQEEFEEQRRVLLAA
jgi:putative membrane protein